MTDTSNPDPESMLPRGVPDYETIVRECYEAGETDGGDGGVPVPAVAERTKYTENTVSKHLSVLAEAGVLSQVWGWPAPGKRPRRGYVPADAVDDGGTDETERRAWM